MFERIKKLKSGENWSLTALIKTIVTTVFSFMEKALRILDQISNLKFRDVLKFVIRKKVLLLTLLLAILLIVPFHDSNAFTEAVQIALDGILSWFISTIVGFLLWIIGLVLMPLFATALGINVSIFTSDGGIVQYGWQLLRDTANMFFILVLLVVAFGTVLQVQTWNFKTILPRFIVAIMLVNFSQILTKTVIIVGNYLYIGVLNAGGGAKGASVMLARVVNLNSAQLASTNSQFNNDNASLLAILAAGIVTITVLLVAASVIFRITLTFFVRLVALWLLVMVSPFALLSMIVPSTQAYGKKWFQELFKYIFIGPIAVFFYVLAIRIGLQPFNFGSGSSASVSIALNGINNFTDITTLTPLIFVLILLWLAGTVAKKGAGMVGEAVYSAGKKGAGKAFSFAAGLGLGAVGGAGRFGLGAIGAGGRYVATESRGDPYVGRLGSFIGKATNLPGVMKAYGEQWKAGSEGRKKDFAQLVRGGFVGRRLKDLQPETVVRDAEIAKMNEISKRWKGPDGTPMDNQGATQKLGELIKGGGSKDEIRMGINLLEKQGYGKAALKTLRGNRTIGQDQNFHDVLNKMYGGKDNPLAQKYGRQFEAIAKEAGDFEHMGEFNFDTGERTPYNEKDPQGKTTARREAAKRQKMAGKRSEIANINVDSITVENEAGDTVGFVKEGFELIEDAIKKGIYTDRTMDHIPQYTHDKINTAAKVSKSWKPDADGQNYLEYRMSEQKKLIKEEKEGREDKTKKPPGILGPDGRPMA